MNYVKSCLLITMLLGLGHSQCNESNWEEYYPDMQGCDLEGANLTGADLREANLEGANLAGANLQGETLHRQSLLRQTLLWHGFIIQTLKGLV